ncbi:glycoside hydrolase family 16 protein [Sodiomyces alcalophilus JCM 7366]|uniref:glycoside hydrolase family 16 protein n=1 Tax=Sodiomyces alcalophilus JCM 7366 TaxID=591952 RepID=UPI0039B5B4B5
MRFSVHSVSLWLCAIPFLSLVGAQQYVLHHLFDHTNFFDEFSFFSEPDPTRGVQRYVSAFEANAVDLAGFANDAVFLGVDYTTPGPWRRSVRVTSNTAYDSGLFIADIAHMPTSSCGVWPAFWMFGPQWPYDGEIDIIEGVNTQDKNKVTLHTGPGCSITNEGTVASTTLKETNCNAGDAYLGCTQATASNDNYGDGFNDIGGGVYAIQWTDEHISVWFFPRGRIPDNVESDSPDPSAWGPALARFNGGEECHLPDHFKKQSLVFNIALCGEWAGRVWGDNAECSALAPTCDEWVADNPDAFAEAYWLINSVRIFQAHEA